MSRRKKSQHAQEGFRLPEVTITERNLASWSKSFSQGVQEGMESTQIDDLA
jgi:hypothetical protein